MVLVWIQDKKENDQLNENKVVLEPRVLPAFAITYFYNHCNIRFDPICENLNMDHYVQVPWNTLLTIFHKLSQKVNNPKWPLDDLWPHICWCPMQDSTQGSLCPTPMIQSMWIQWPFFKKKKGQWCQDDLWPHFCWGHMCDSTQGSLCPSPMKIHQSMWIQWPFFKTWTKGHWPLEKLWPHVYWGHMCDSTQGSLCPSHGNTSMYVDTVINFVKYHIHTTYILRTEWVIT